MATEEERVKGVVMPAFGRMLWRHGGEPGMLIPLLQAAQDSYGYIPPLAIDRITSYNVCYTKLLRYRPSGCRRNWL